MNIHEQIYMYIYIYNIYIYIQYIHTFKRRGIPFLYGWHWAWPRFFNPWLASLGISPPRGPWVPLTTRESVVVLSQVASARFVVDAPTKVSGYQATARDGNAGCFLTLDHGISHQTNNRRLPVDSVWLGRENCGKLLRKGMGIIGWPVDHGSEREKATLNIFDDKCYVFSKETHN